MFAVTAFHFCFLIVQINLCTPVSQHHPDLGFIKPDTSKISKQWDPAVVGGNCLTAVPFYTSMASLTIMFDIIMYGPFASTPPPHRLTRLPYSMILPFPVLITTQIPPKKKLILLGLFSLGIFITIIQIVRIQTIHSLQNYLDSSMLIMWSMVENNLGIIIASIPALSPLIRSWREKTSKTGGGSSERGRGGSYALGTLGTKDGRLRLASQNDRGLRGGEEGKSMTRTVVKSGTYHHGRGAGDNSSEECIVPGKGLQEGILTTTEIRVEEENAYAPGSRGNPFKDPKTARAV